MENNTPKTPPAPNTWSNNNKRRVIDLIEMIEDQIQIDGIGQLNRIVKINNQLYQGKFRGYEEVKMTINKLLNPILILEDKTIKIINDLWLDFPNKAEKYVYEDDLQRDLSTAGIPFGLSKHDLDNNLILELWWAKSLEETKKTLSEYKNFAINNIVPLERLNKVAYWVTYSKNREILVNNQFLLSKPDFDGENDNFFEYIYKYAGDKLSRNEIQENLKRKLKKTNHQILEGLGFRGEIRKLFFPGVSKNSLIFRVSISQNDIAMSTINIKTLENELQKLRDRNNQT